MPLPLLLLSYLHYTNSSIGRTGVGPGALVHVCRRDVVLHEEHEPGAGASLQRLADVVVTLVDTEIGSSTLLVVTNAK